MLEAAKNLLASIDSDELLDEFLELQENACGPTIQDFFKTIMRSTNDLFGFSDFTAQAESFVDMDKINIADWSVRFILNSSRDFNIKSANDDKYHLYPQEMKNNESFLNEDDYFALAS